MNYEWKLLGLQLLPSSGWRTGRLIWFTCLGSSSGTTGWEGLVCFRVRGPWRGRSLPTCRFSAGHTETSPTVNSHLGRNQQCRWWLLASTISTPIQGLFPACSWSPLGISLVLLQDRESSTLPSIYLLLKTLQSSHQSWEKGGVQSSLPQTTLPSLL